MLVNPCTLEAIPHSIVFLSGPLILGQIGYKSIRLRVHFHRKPHSYVVQLHFLTPSEVMMKRDQETFYRSLGYEQVMMKRDQKTLSSVTPEPRQPYSEDVVVIVKDQTWFPSANTKRDRDQDQSLFLQEDSSK